MPRHRPATILPTTCTDPPCNRQVELTSAVLVLEHDTGSLTLTRGELV